MHQAQSVSDGVRCNLILWARSAKYRKVVGCPMCDETRMLVKGIYDEVDAAGA